MERETTEAQIQQVEENIKRLEPVVENNKTYEEDIKRFKAVVEEGTDSEDE
jgi:hypothetical protein